MRDNNAILGSMASNEWVWDYAKWRYFGSDGAGYTGLATVDGITYLFDSNGGMQTGWVSFGGNWYYFDSSGAMACNGWRYINRNWYYFGSNGVMGTGLRWIDGSLYYLSTGAMCTDWHCIDGNWYYFDLFSGTAVTGQQKVFELRHGQQQIANFNANGIFTGWVK